MAVLREGREMKGRECVSVGYIGEEEKQRARERGSCINDLSCVVTNSTAQYYPGREVLPASLQGDSDSGQHLVENVLAP